MRQRNKRYAQGGMITVKTDDGEVLKYKIDTDEKSIEVDEATKQYLSDIVLVLNRDFRKLNNTYIFWYDEMSDDDIEELEEVFKTRLTKYADGGKVKKPFFRDRTAKLREPFNKGFEGLAKATGNEALTKVGKMASGGNVWDEDLNVYTLVSSKEYFGSDTASDKRRWFRRNGRGLTRDQAKRMAQDYIDRYGKERVYIGNIRHYR